MLKISCAIRRQPLRNSVLIAVLVALLHICATIILVRLSSVTQSADRPSKPIQIKNIDLPKRKVRVIELDDLSITGGLQIQAMPLQTPEVPIFTIRDDPVSPLTYPSSLSSSSVNEGVIFDPRLRERVSAEKPADSAQIADSWTNSSNVQWVKLRDGRCLRSMQVHNSRSDERTWANKPCGKDPGEEMADDLTKALQRR